jgi:hypothetical protein
MSDEKKIYWPRSGAKQIDFANGGNLLKLNFHVETAIAWLKEHANDRGYITVGVTRRRSVGERGDTHCIWLDTWKPDASKACRVAKNGPIVAASRENQEDFIRGQMVRNAPPIADQAPLPGDDDVPF